MLIKRRKPVTPDHDNTPGPRRQTSALRFLKDKTGAAAIEFAILAVPFFLIVIASLETFTAFTGEQLLAHATETMARKLRTGEITVGTGNLKTDMDGAQFRKAFCDEIAIIMPCSGSELQTPTKFFIDVRSYTDFSKIPAAIPRKSNSDLDTAGFKFAPGGPTTINVVRAFYRWEVVTDLARPYVTNLRPAGTTMPRDYLMVSTAAYRNENY